MSGLSIVMPCHNHGYDLLRVLRAYDHQSTEEPIELIAIDDASTDETFQVLDSYRPTRLSLRVERLERNQGPATARNRGIALASAPIILFVGDDILPEPNLIQGHLEAHGHHPESQVAILGRVAWAEDLPQNTLMRHIDGIGAQQFSYHYLRDGKEYDFRHLYTSNVSLKRDFLLSLDHWFDTDFSDPAFEDVELAYRLAKSGLRIIYSADLLAHHDHYHTIWSFSTRQYRCGLMAWILMRKHPGVLRVLYRQCLKVLALLGELSGLIWPYRDQVLNTLEREVLCLSSLCEWLPNSLLDELYLRVLDYFYYKGLIEGIFGKLNLGLRMKSAHAKRSLVPTLDWFRSAARNAQIPFPSQLNVVSPYERMPIHTKAWARYTQTQTPRAD